MNFKKCSRSVKDSLSKKLFCLNVLQAYTEKHKRTKKEALLRVLILVGKTSNIFPYQSSMVLV